MYLGFICEVEHLFSGDRILFALIRKRKSSAVIVKRPFNPNARRNAADDRRQVNQMTSI
jgi:hypothetical protein